MLQSSIINSWTDVSLKSRYLVDATSSTSCMRQLVLVDVSMSDFISRWGYVVQMSMNCLYVSVFTMSQPTVLLHDERFQDEKECLHTCEEKTNRCIREHVINQEKVNVKEDDLKGFFLSFVGVQGFTLSWFNLEDAVFRVWTARLNTTPAASLVWLGVSANPTNRNKLKSTSTLQRWTPPG